MMGHKELYFSLHIGPYSIADSQKKKVLDDSCTIHRLTYPKGIHSFRYFLYANLYVVFSCMLHTHMHFIAIRPECVHHSVCIKV